MSNKKNPTNYLNKNFKESLKKQQENIIKLVDNQETKDLLTPIFNDYNYEKFQDINHNLKELPQYSASYHKRLEQTKNKIVSDSKKKWPKINICKNLLDLKGSVS